MEPTNKECEYLESTENSNLEVGEQNFAFPGTWSTLGRYMAEDERKRLYSDAMGLEFPFGV